MSLSRVLRPRWTGSAVTSIALLLSALAAADPASTEDRALAEALFREGKALLEAGDSSAACKKLEESRRLESAGGTVIALAICYEYAGKTASAWAEFQVALGLARRDQREDRAALATERIAALEQTLYWVSIRVPDGNRELSDFRVERNGSPVSPGSWGTPMALDPGEHVFTASASDHVSWSQTVHVPKGSGEKALVVPELTSNTSPPPAETRPMMIPPRSREMAGDETGTERAIGYALVGVGAVSLATAGYFSLKSISARSRVEGGCIGNQCAEEIQGDYEAVPRWDRAAAITGGAGLLAAAAGTYLLVRSTASDEHARGANWLGISLIGAGAGAVAVGGVLTVRGVADSNRVWARCEIGRCDASDLAGFDRAADYHTAGIVLISVGAASAGTGVYFLTAPSGSSARNASPLSRPWLRATLGGLKAGFPL
jgi:hypothetical protein